MKLHKKLWKPRQKNQIVIPRPNRMIFEQLEPRLLLAADLSTPLTATVDLQTPATEPMLVLPSEMEATSSALLELESPATPVTSTNELHSLSDLASPEVEPNNTLATATTLPLTEDPAGSGLFLGRGLGRQDPATSGTSWSDPDYWRFEALAGDVVSISVDTPESGVDPYVELVNAADSKRASDDNSGPGNDAFISHYTITDSGSYYVKVGKYSSSTTTGSYDLRVVAARGIQLETDRIPRNDYISVANALTFATADNHKLATVAGAVLSPEGSETDEDLFSLGVLNPGNVVELSVRQPSGSTLLPWVTLRDSSGALVADEDGASPNGHVMATLTAAGVYYAQMESIWAHEGHVYLLTSGTMTWAAAEAEAVALGGHLVTVTDAGEQAWLTATFGPSGGGWIGYTDQAVEGTWEWISGESPTYSNWSTGIPNTSSGDYASMITGGQWAPRDNLYSYRGIVELVLPGVAAEAGPSPDAHYLLDVDITDMEPPQVSEVSDMPGAELTTDDPLQSFTVNLTEDLRPATVTAANAWDLREAGLDGLFDTGDDQVYQIILGAPYTGGTSVQLFTQGGPLPDGHYRFTASASLQDLHSHALDGDGDGTGGDAWHREFFVALPSGLTLENGDNNTLATATTLPLTEDPAGSGLFLGRGLGRQDPATYGTNWSDPDYWRFEALAGDLVSVSVDTPESGVDPYVELVDAADSPKAFDNDSGPGNDALISHYTITSSGSYYVRVTKYYSSTTAGSYELRLDVARGIQLESDANYSNDSISGANALTLQTIGTHKLATVAGAVMSPSWYNKDEDLFSLGVLDPDNVVVLSVRQPSGSTLLPWVTLRDSSGALVADLDGASPNGRVQAILTAAGVYYAQMESIWAHEGHVYLLTSGPMSWAAAEAEAVARGGHLVTVSDAGEQAWLTATFGQLGEGNWIGYTDQAVEGTWEWISGESATYSNWNTGQPDSSSDDYVYMSSGGRWYSYDGASSYRGIVELVLPGVTGEAGPGPYAQYLLETAVLPIGELAFPDLRVIDIVLPTAAVSGETVPLSWTVENFGTEPIEVASWSDRVVLSSNDQYGDGDDVPLTSAPHTGSLNGGEHYTAEVDVQLPPGYSGNFWVFVETDPNNEVFEYMFESNNIGQSASQLPITLTPLADLEVGEVVAQSLGVAGEPISLSWTVRNAGENTTGNGLPGVVVTAWTDRVVLSANAQYGDADDRLVAEVPHSGSLAPGASYPGSYTGPLPMGLSGDYQVMVYTDAGGLVYEGNDTHANLAQAPGPLTVAPQVFADLTVTGVTSPASAVLGQSITVQWTVENTENAWGATPVSQWYDRVVLSQNDVFGDADDRVLGQFRHTGALDRSAGYSGSGTVALPTEVRGDYQLFVAVDGNNAVYEYPFEGNNFSSPQPLTITGPDLVLDLASAPDTVQLGAPFEVIWTGRNAGNAAPLSTQWYDRVILSSNDTCGDGDDQILGQFLHTGALDPGQSYTGSGSVMLSSSPGGSYHLFVVLDGGDAVAEFPYEGNNISLAQPLTITGPDLVVAAVTLPAGAQFGRPLALSWTVQNQGSAATRSSWSDRLWFSSDTALGSDDTLLSTVAVNLESSLAVGESYTPSASPLLPLSSSLLEGQYYLLVQTDALAGELEIGESNNLSVSPPVSLAFPLLPDLVVSDIFAPVEGIAGQPLPISWTLTNQGAASASPSWTDTVYLSSDDAAGGDQLVGTFSFTGEIPAGQSVTRQQNVTLPGASQGHYWLVVQTDSGQTIFEHLHEDNNTAVDDQALQVLPAQIPNLQVASVTPPVSAFSSQPTVVAWTVTNNGTGATSAPLWRDAVYLSLDAAYDTSDLRLGAAANASYLGVGESYANSLTVTLPQGIAGEYYLLVKTDYQDMVDEGDHEGDNVGAGGPMPVELTPPPDLQVTSVVTPAQAFSGQPLTVSWQVTNQGPGQTLKKWWDDAIYLSTDEILDAHDPGLKVVDHEGALAAGESYTAASTVTLPTGITGQFYIMVLTDTHEQVYEHVYEGNNTGYDLTQVLLTAPDLEVTVVSAPSAALAGHDLSLAYRVDNWGATATPNTSWTDSFYLSPDPVLDGTDLSLGYRYHSGALAAGGFYENTASFTLANGLSGAYYALVATDRSNVVFELDNANNTLASPAPISIIASRPADLVVAAASAPETGEAGGQVRVSWTVQNLGVGDTNVENWRDGVFFSQDGVFDRYEDPRLACVGHSGRLNPGESYTQSELVDLPFTFSGQYQIFVLADGLNSVSEGTDEGNNLSLSLPITITRQTSDLQVATVTAPAAAVAGSSLPVAWRVENLGPNRTNATYWYDQLYLSRDQVISSDDRALASCYHANSLEPGAWYDGGASLALPGDLPQGLYYVLVRTDSSNRVLEDPSELNNDATSAAIQITPATPGAGVVPVPDLRLESVEAPLEAVSGQTFSLSWTVVNDGDPTGNRTWYDAVYLSQDQIFDRNSDVYVGYRNHPGGLAAAASYTASQDFTIPQGLSGPFYVFVAADSGSHVAGEASELNNTAYDGLSMLVSLAPPADLAVGIITIPATAVPGQNATLSFSVTNQGDSPAPGSWYDSLYISADGHWDLGDALFGRVRHSGGLAAGASYSRSLTAPLPGITPGDYQVILRSDIFNQVREDNEANNIGASLDRVDIDALALTLGTAATGALAQGQSAYYRLDVQAGETLRLSLDSDSANAANELYLRYGAMPTRGQFDFAAADPYTADPSLVVPVTNAGTYYVLVFGQTVPETPADYTLTAAILPFGIENITAPRGGNVGQVTVQIDGAKFNNVTRVELLKDSVVLEPVWVTIADPTTIMATFDLTGQPVGLYDVRVVSEQDILDFDEITGEIVETHVVYGDATLSGGFEVVAGGGPEVRAQLLLPLYARPDKTFSFSLEVANTGNTDVPAPVYLVVSPNGTPVSASPQVNLDSGSQEQILVLGQKRSTVLAPGESVTVPLFARPGNQSDSQFILQALNFPETPVDWEFLESYYRDASPEAEWTATWNNFLGIVGGTWDSLHEAMRRLASDLALATPEPETFFTGNMLILNLLARAAIGQHDVSGFLSQGSTPAGEAYTGMVALTDAGGGNLQPLGLLEGDPLPPDPRLIPLLIDAEDYLDLVFLPTSLYLWGQDVHDLYYAYLHSTPPPMFLYLDGEEIVEGTPQAVGFKKDPVTIEFVNSTLDEIKCLVEEKIKSGEYSCSNLPEEIDVYEILPPEFFANVNDQDQSPLDYPNPSTIGGVTAGYVGESSHGLDQRLLKGSVKLLPNYDQCHNLTSISLVSDFNIYIVDCIDFDPGELGSWKAMFVTAPMKFLEQNHWANDTKFTVDFHPDPQVMVIDASIFPEECTKRKTPLQPPAGECASPPDPCNPSEGDGNCFPGAPSFSGVPPESVPTLRPQDPNDIVGPGGFGNEHWVPAWQVLPYTIRFENAAEATAPAQQVMITQQLDDDLDWRSFRVGDFGWGDLYFDVPDNRAFYIDQLDLTSTQGFVVDVAAGIDLATGQAFWTLTTIDPATGEPPADVLAGFLPPNNDTGRGDGFVSYTVKARRTAATGDVVDAEARIIFDTEEPMDTPPIFNTLDAAAPASSVTALPTSTAATEFLVTWSGRDDEGGSAIADFTIYVSDSGAEFVPWLSSTTRTDAVFTGQPGHIYAFSSIARDYAGNIETAPNNPDTLILITDGSNAAPSLTPIGNQQVDEGAALSFTLSATDPDVPAQSLTFSATGLPTGASLDPASGLFSWTPSETQGPGTYEVTFGVTDGALSDTETIQIQVHEVNAAPVAVDDTAITKQNTAVVIGVLANDTDPENNPLQIASFTQPTHGAVADLGDGFLTYTPTAGFSGLDTFTYTSSDGQGGTDTGSVNLTITYAPPTSRRRLPTPPPLPPPPIQTLATASVPITPVEAVLLFNPANGELAPPVRQNLRPDLRSLKFDPAIWHKPVISYDNGEEDWIVEL